MDEPGTSGQIPSPIGGIRKAHLDAVARARSVSFTLGEDLSLVAVNGVNPAKVKFTEFTTALRASWAFRERSKHWLESLVPGQLKQVSLRIETVRRAVSFVGHVLLRVTPEGPSYDFSLNDVSDSLVASLRSSVHLSYRAHMPHYLQLINDYDKLTCPDCFKKEISSLFDKLLSGEALEAVILKSTGLHSSQHVIARWRFEPPNGLAGEVSALMNSASDQGFPEAHRTTTIVFRRGKFKSVRVACATIPRFPGSSIAFVYTGKQYSEYLLEFVVQNNRFFEQLFDRLLVKQVGHNNLMACAALVSKVPATLSLCRRAAENRCEFKVIPVMVRSASLIWEGREKCLAEIDALSSKYCIQALELGIPYSARYKSDDPAMLADLIFEPLETPANRPQEVMRLIVERGGSADVSARCSGAERLFDAMPCAILLFDGSLRTLFANKAACELLGCKDPVASGSLVSELPGPGVGWPALVAWAGRAKHRGGDEGDACYEFRHNGRYLKARCHAIEGTTDRFLLSVDDITVDHDRIESLQNYRMVMDRTTDAVVELDEELRISSFNAGASTMFGLVGADIGTKLESHLFIRSYAGHGFVEMVRDADADSLWVGKAIVRVPDLYLKNTHVRVACLKDEEGAAKGYTVIISDETGFTRERLKQSVTSWMTEVFARGGFRLDQAERALEVLRRTLMLKRICVVLTSHLCKDGPLVLPESSGVFLNSGSVRTVRSLVRAEFRGRQLVADDDAKNLFNAITSSGESLLSPPEWAIELEQEGRAVGVLMLWESSVQGDFSPIEMDVVTALAGQLAPLLEHALQLEQFQRNRGFVVDVLQAVPYPAFVFDRLGRVRFCNRSFHAIFGSPAGKNVLKDPIISDPRVLREKGVWKEVLLGLSVSFEAKLKKPDGACDGCCWRITPLPGDSTHSAGSHFLAIGTPSATASETPLAGAIGASGEAAALLHHYFKNFIMKLSALSMHLEIERDIAGLKPSERLSQMNREISRCSEAMKALSEIARAFSREPSSFALDDLVEFVVSETSNSFPGVQFTTDLNSGATIAGHQGLVRVLLTEVIANAGEAASERESGKVHVRTGQARAEHGKACLIEVTDNGPGMPDLAGIEASGLFRTTRPDGDRPRGTGLLKAELISKLHSGSIVHAHLPEGTRVSITLRAQTVVPASPASQSRTAATTPDSDYPGVAPSGPVDLLLLDDDEGILELVKEMLSDIGLKCTAFASPQPLIRAVASNPQGYSVALIDCELGGFSGLDIAVEICRLGFKGPIFMLTGHSIQDIDISRCRSIVGVIEKPVDRKLLRSSLRIFLPREASE